MKSCVRQFSVIIPFGLSLLVGEFPERAIGQETGTISFTLYREQITDGPGHHLFGYIGQSLTIPWNASGRYILALQTHFHDHLPGPDDAAKVVVVDTTDGNRIIPFDRTLGWNLQQGTMFYWNPGKPDTQFFFNDRDPVSGRVFTVLFDIDKGKRISILLRLAAIPSGRRET